MLISVCVVLEYSFFQLSHKVMSALTLNVLFVISHAAITRFGIVHAYYCRPASKKRKQMTLFESSSD